MHPLKAQIHASIAKQIAEVMQNEPESEVWKTIQQCTCYEEALRELVKALNESQASAKALGMLIDDYTKRKQRLNKQIEAKRAFIVEMMNTAGIRNAPLPEATISMRASAPSVIITDASLLPDDLTDRKPKVSAIKDRLKAGDAVPGATLSNGGETIIIRVK